MRNDWYAIKNIDAVDSPALVIYPERVKENIRLAIEMIGDVERLRPHAKTHKSTEATRLLLQAGIQKFKCATIAEAEMLATEGSPDVLLAYQPVGPKLHRFISLIKKYPRTTFSCLIDNYATAEAIASVALQADTPITVYVDVNVGMNRTGVSPDKVLRLYEYCASLSGLKLGGLHAYDGHIKNLDLAQRTIECGQVFAPVEQIKNELKANGYEALKVIVGGTPTYPVHAQRRDVECSPGTFIYWDRGYEISCPEQKFLPAALVITRIISLPDETTLCLDLGHKSVAAENELQRRVYFLNAPDVKFISQSEEHMVVQIPEGHLYKIGDVFYGLPYHICPTCALYERAVVVEDGFANGEWKIAARDRKLVHGS